MTNIRSLLQVSLCFFACSQFSLFATEWNKSEDKALTEVLDMLSNPGKRQEAMTGDAQAQESDKILKSVGGDQSEQLYQLAGKIFESLLTQHQGNIDQVEAVLKQAQKNPEGFLNNLNPELKNTLKELASKIEKNQNTRKP